MAEFDDDAQKPNGSFAEVTDDDDLTLYLVLRRIMAPIFAPDTTSDAPRLRRFRNSLAGNFPLLPKAIRNSGRHVALWTRRGSPLRALLVISVGIIALLAVTGLLVFMLFFLAATFNAIVISLLMSLAAAGGFLALFFAFVTAIYIGALSVAVVVISTTTISAIIAVIITTGWIGFLWTVWLVTNRSVAFAKHSLGMSGSAIAAYSSARQATPR